MATSAFARISGPVLNTNRRQETARDSGKSYDFTLVTVLVGGRGTTEFAWPNTADICGPLPTIGEPIDVICEVTNGDRGFRLQPVGLADSQVVQALADALALSS